MSTMTVSPQFYPVQAPRTVRPTAAAARLDAQRVRLTRRGRLVLTGIFLAGVLLGMAVFGGWATASLTAGTPEPVDVVEVQSGDTLYGLAADVAAPGEVREMVYRIQELNSLPGAQISEGQRLAVPRG